MTGSGNTIDYSILLATRGRPSQVERLFQSILDTADHPEAIEIILYMDDDDHESHTINHPSLKLKKLIGPKISMGGMHRRCYEASAGNLIMIVGDDNVFRTRSWDTRVMEEFKRFPDDIGLVYCNDLIQGRNMCTAPFLTRKACDFMDSICPDDYTGEFIDTHILDVFTKLKYWGYIRIAYLDDIVIEHLHYVAGKAAYDETYANKAPTNENRNLFFRLDPDRVATARKIVHYISGGTKS